MEFSHLSLSELDALVASGATTHQEIYDYFLDRARRYNDTLNAFNTLPTETEVHGLPIAVKDLFCEQ